MTKHVLMGLLFAEALCTAQVPEPTITYKSTYSGHATIAGKLASKPSVPVGISVQNGSLIYSTITDAEGRWGIVIRHTSTSLTVQSWDLQNPGARSEEKTFPSP